MAKSFNVGDVVKYVGDPQFWDKGGIHIIHEAQRDGGQFQYSTTHGAWFSDSDFELVRKADKASLKQLDACIRAEEGEDDE